MDSSSPKRKRDHIHRLDTKGPGPRLLSDSDLEEFDGGSPRTKVARKFDDLEIHGYLTLDGHDGGSTLSANTRDEASVNLQEATSLSFNSEEKVGGQPIKCSVVSSPGTSSQLAKTTIKTPRAKSPPLEGEISEEFWHDSEITGHNPDDPSDDGYGINGIGFRPTAAMAWSRSQRRKQQLIDYKNREAKDARQQRSERRKRFISESEDAPSVESSPRKSIRVHFEDG